MPSARGTVRAVVGSTRSIAAIILTNDRWNAVYPSAGVVPVRKSIQPHEAPHSVQLSKGGFAVVSDLVNVLQSPHPESPLGAQLFVVPPDELAAIEDRLCLFLQLPRLLGPRPMKSRPAPAASAYPFWSEIYFVNPPIEGELKRHAVVSPDAWNAASSRATVIRTTSKIKRDHDPFRQSRVAGRERPAAT